MNHRAASASSTLAVFLVDLLPCPLRLIAAHRRRHPLPACAWLTCEATPQRPPLPFLPPPPRLLEAQVGVRAESQSRR